MLITIEGIDGCGKSTLIEGLKKELADLQPLFTREPGNTWIGDQVRRGVAEEIDPIAEALLFTADHAAHLRKIIRPALEQEKIVISDRYSDSRYAYQTATLAGVLPDAGAWIRGIHEGWTIVPDRTYLLTIPVEEALKRLDEKENREHFERENVLVQVQAEYLKIARQDPRRFIVIDAMQEKEKIVSFVAEDIRRCSES